MIHEDNTNMLANINAIKQSAKGTSFRINKWTSDTYYMYNEQYIDWVHIDGALLVCKRTHVSNEDNKPIITIENKKLVLKDSPCWEFIFGLESSVTIDNISQLRFENGILQLSNDNGNTWETILDTNHISPAPMGASVINTYSTTEESSANVNLVDNELQFTFAIQKGRDGKDGKDGVNGNPGKDGIDGTDGKDGKDGIDGKDGAGIEYIFALSAIETVIWKNSGLELPDNTWVFDNPNEPWCDEPKSVSSEYPIQWVSKRVKPEGSGVWNNWSKPTVWSTYGTIGMTTTVVKLWKRSDSPIQEIIPPSVDASYNIFTNKLTFDEGSTNGWSHNGASNTGRYLYSLGVSISTNTTNYIIKPENWTILNLESVDGIDGSGQSSVTMTVDPDSIIVNIDSNNKTKWSRTFSCTSNYYYGGTNINSSIEISSSDKYTVNYEDKNTTEHVFTITINEDVEFSNVEHLIISLTPESQDLGEDGILSLPVLNRSILLNPIKSEDIWGISLNKDNIIITDRTLSDTTILTAHVTKNYVKYTGEDVKLSYKLPNENYTEYTGDININNTTITSGEIEFKLELNNVPILYQSVSIIYVKDGANGKDGVDGSNGEDGADGRGINNTTNYYLISDKSTGIESPTEDTINGWQKDQFDYEECDENTPYVWLSNCIEYSDGEKIFTPPIIVFMYNMGKDGRSIKSVYEYYMYSTLKDGEDHNYIPNPNWDDYDYNNPQTLTNYDGTSWTYNEVPDLNEGESLLWNVEVIIYDVNDGYSHTSPIQLSNRAHEIENIQEYYKASNEFLEETFDSESSSSWSLDRPELSNETPYLWNAELITYVNGVKKYTVPNRIDIFLKENVIFETSTKVLTGYIDQSKTISFKKTAVNYKLNVDGENKFLGEDDFKLAVDPNSIFSVSYDKESLIISLSETVNKDNYSGPHRQILNFKIQKGDKILTSSCIYVDFITNRFTISEIDNIYIPSEQGRGEYYISDAFNFKITDSLNNKVYSNYTINIDDPENKWSEYFEIVSNNGKFNIIVHYTSGLTNFFDPYAVYDLLKTEMPLTIKVYDDNWQTVITNISHSIKIMKKTPYDVNIKFLKNYSYLKPGDIIEFYLQHDDQLITHNDLLENSSVYPNEGYTIKVYVDDSVESLNINCNEVNDYLFNVEIPETNNTFSYNLLQIFVKYTKYYVERTKIGIYQCGYAKIVRNSWIMSDWFLNNIPTSINTDKTYELRLPDGLRLYDNKTENLVSTIVIDRSEIGDKECRFFNSDGKLIWKTDVHLYKTWYISENIDNIYYIDNKNTIAGYKIPVPELTNGYDVTFDQNVQYNYKDGVLVFPEDFEFNDDDIINLTHSINGKTYTTSVNFTPIDLNNYNNYLVTNNYSIPITLSGIEGDEIVVNPKNIAVLSNINVSSIKLPYVNNEGNIYNYNIQKPQKASAKNCSGIEQPAIQMNVVSSYQEFNISENMVLTYPYMENGIAFNCSELEIYNAVNKTYILKFNLIDGVSVDYSTLYENKCTSLNSTDGKERFICLKYQISEDNNINIKPIIEWIH